MAVSYTHLDVYKRQSYITSKCEMTMKEIQTYEDMDSWNLMPRSAVQISNSEIVMPCLLKNHLSFLKIIF